MIIFIIGISLIGFALFLIPLITFLTYKVYDESMKLRGIYISEKYYGIDNLNFENVPLRPIRKEIITNDYEKTLVIFDVASTKVSSEQRMYTGTNLGGIKIPFATAGFTSRKFYNKKGYTKYGESRLYLTNTAIRVYCFNEPFRWSVAIPNIVTANITRYGKSIELEVSLIGTNTNEIKERFEIDFLSTEEVVYFLNCLWTINHKGYRYYKDMNENFSDYNAFNDKIITRWDIKRIKNETKKYPELKNIPWQEIEKSLKEKNSIRKLDQINNKNKTMMDKKLEQDILISIKNQKKMNSKFKMKKKHFPIIKTLMI